MLFKIIQFSLKNKLIVLLFTIAVIGFGFFSLTQIPIGAVPDITNNQVQVITTSRNLATEDVEKFLTYPVELEMANLPNVQEIRSVSKFGLSVVTVVFDDKIGSYLPRQLIAEKIKAAEEKIPAGFGKPFMGPITTGLGEIYQYVIEVDSANKSQYSLTDIRSIQDWIVKRQLSGIPGVVEVNTWGGYLKQYEVAVNPSVLRSMDISLNQIFEALEKNNSVAGGAYIEKTHQTYFIRGEGLVKTLQDIENIVVDTKNDVPVFIRDIASVGFGHAPRFGAITGNGDGEKVLGQVMMIKGGNSKEVIEAVKNRVEQIATTLPPGVSINGFLERSELIQKTTATISENLILGCLIVIFVVVLLLGNLRSGLVVASVIPMCLLFALSLMYIFGVDANLMSLGAIDFGIIIDGAVIIVEFIAFKISAQKEELIGLDRKGKQKIIDKITLKSTNKMMHSAVFGQLIIIIVFIPILSLVGIEGKMFRPMALVFTFALIGAMIFCFTYVPVIASLFIKPSKNTDKNISQRLISFLQNKYKPILMWALNHRKIVLSFSLIILLFSGFIFSRMGGEFIPTLDEGDFVIQPVLKTGTSLSNTVLATTQIEKILKQFPEVDQVVTRIGAAEVPTDPMSMEESDVIIKLKPKKQWTTAQNKDELANAFKEALSVIPGIDYEFTQPIEMRFNELITGVRADIAIKIFGEDLDILYNKALEVEKAIKNVEGASDITVEKVAGLPQMSIKYNRKKLARYGMNVEEINNLITMGFAGKTAGTVFEGEKQFDLVLRYDQQHRQDISDIENASIELNNGEKAPLSAFADIDYTKGPAMISRDNTKRRIVIGINVRNRDLESVVKDLERNIKQQVKLPVGYSIEYGGQFQNLKTAKKRLLVAVPVALILIFIMLYFAFNSLKDALIIFGAIPLSAVGGIILLYMRGLPFSISAGVGFIALFGIAVLNGIVLIEEFKELKAKGMKNIHEIIIQGTQNRLRPVILTASAAALGFLPMAISESAGAEVQRPLATVVIGGLISATLLTLLVLPILYAVFDKKKFLKNKSQLLAFIGIVLTALIPRDAHGQESKISLSEAINVAINNNLGIKAMKQKTEQKEQLIQSAFNPDKTEFYFNRDNNNIAPNNLALNVWGIDQNFQFPTVYGAQKKVLEGKFQLAKQEFELEKFLLIKKVSQTYYQMVYWQQMKERFYYLDSLYQSISLSAQQKFEMGASNYLEKLTTQTKTKEISLKLNKIDENINSYKLLFNQLLQAKENFLPQDQNLLQLTLVPLDTQLHPSIQYDNSLILLSNYQKELEKNKLLPDLNTTAFLGTNNGSGQQNYTGFQIGLALPLWHKAQKSRVDAAKTQIEISKNQKENHKTILASQYSIILSQLNALQSEIDYYEKSGSILSLQTLFHAKSAYENGEINYLNYIQLIEQAQTIETNYLKALLDYNLLVLDANYLIDEK